MSRELTPLEALHKLMFDKSLDTIPTIEEDAELLRIVETALKRLENYEQNEDFNKDVLNYAFLNEQDKIKKLKALEIIKEKNVCIHDFIKSKTLEEYNSCREWEEELTEEEYDLLKEVLL